MIWVIIEALNNCKCAPTGLVVAHDKNCVGLHIVGVAERATEAQSAPLPSLNDSVSESFARNSYERLV